MKTKLTAISVTYKNKRVTKFVQCEYVNGKAILSQEQLNRILSDAFGTIPRGATYSIG
jgi:predicted phage tail protein